jgi:hypothetical protein
MKTQIPNVPKAPVTPTIQKLASVRDQRPDAVAQAKLREMAATSPQAKQLKALQNLAQTRNPVQRAIAVDLVTNEAKRKSIAAVGTVKDFTGGSSAGDYGWINVRKYRSWYQIEETDGTVHAAVNSPTMQNLLTTPERGHALAKQNGGDGTDPKNVFAQDGGSNNGPYKSFEIGMRKDLDKYGANDEVVFKSYLEGKNIKKGEVASAALSEASEIDSDSDSD